MRALQFWKRTTERGMSWHEIKLSGSEEGYHSKLQALRSREFMWTVNMHHSGTARVEARKKAEHTCALAVELY